MMRFENQVNGGNLIKQAIDSNSSLKILFHS